MFSKGVIQNKKRMCKPNELYCFAHKQLHPSVIQSITDFITTPDSVRCNCPWQDCNNIASEITMSMTPYCDVIVHRHLDGTYYTTLVGCTTKRLKCIQLKNAVQKLVNSVMAEVQK